MPDYVVRYGVMRFLGVFSAASGREYSRGARIIARTNRGLEAGEVLCEATAEVVRQLQDLDTGQILRAMTVEDRNELNRIQQQAKHELEICQQHVERLGLAMQLIEAEHLFGGERVVVYYLAESRVDFRELVRLLAGEFQTRIEMRQIGVRDEAKLLADYGDCGYPVCCNTHLIQMPPVSMRMAKLQKATLDPTKISGRCGRLKCCLRYEYETYEDMERGIPILPGQPFVANSAMAAPSVNSDETTAIPPSESKGAEPTSPAEESAPAASEPTPPAPLPPDEMEAL
jgi:cell fate regulator YaaT (PSP1 superfamily)